MQILNANFKYGKTSFFPLEAISNSIFSFKLTPLTTTNSVDNKVTQSKSRGNNNFAWYVITVNIENVLHHI